MGDRFILFSILLRREIQVDPGGRRKLSEWYDDGIDSGCVVVGERGVLKSERVMVGRVHRVFAWPQHIEETNNKCIGNGRLEWVVEVQEGDSMSNELNRDGLDARWWWILFDPSGLKLGNTRNHFACNV